MSLKSRIKRIIGLAGAYKLRALIRFVSDFWKFRQLSAQSPQQRGVLWSNRYPCLGDRTALTAFDPHYIYHPAWAARVLAQTRPACHVDISSSLHFCTIVSGFIPVKFYDYRPAPLQLSDLETGAVDLLALPFADGSIESLSCMHVVEHIGLGRYGDPLDADGDLKAMAQLKRVLAPGGSLLFVTPVGRPGIMFNAHRIYSYEAIVQAFDGLQLHEFSLIPDNGYEAGIIHNASASVANAQTYGCGCFWFKRGRE